MAGNAGLAQGRLPVGQRLVIQYRGEDERWQEMLVVASISTRLYICWTTLSTYKTVNLDGSNVAAVRLLPARGGRPAGLVGRITSFRAAVTAAKLRELCVEADTLARLDSRYVEPADDAVAMPAVAAAEVVAGDAGDVAAGDVAVGDVGVL